MLDLAVCTRNNEVEKLQLGSGEREADSGDRGREAHPFACGLSPVCLATRHSLMENCIRQPITIHK